MILPRKSGGARTQPRPIVVPIGRGEDTASAMICSPQDREDTSGAEHYYPPPLAWERATSASNWAGVREK